MISLPNIIFTLQNIPTQVVFKLHKKNITAEQFIADIQILAEKIAATKYQRWALCYQDSYLFCVALLAALLCAREPILLANNQPGTIANFSKYYDAILSDMTDIPVTCLPDKKSVSLSTILPGALCVSMFTSGSTGKPKKVDRTLTQLMAEITVLESIFHETVKDTVIYSSVSHQHAYGIIFYILWPLCANRIISVPMLDYPEQIEAAILNEPAITLISSPALLKRMSTNTTSSQKLSVFSAGGLLENTTAEYVFTSLKAYPNEILGSTETGAVAHRQQLRDTNWQPLAEVKLSLDQATQCLKVHSDFFAHNNGFVMGDNVTFNADGTFVLHGRADRIAKIEGKRISLSEMETLLKQHPWVSDAYILTMQNHREYLAAVIALHQTALNRLKNDKKSFFNAQFNGILSNTFERSLLPKQFRYVEHIPVNSQGKYVPSELRELFK